MSSRKTNPQGRDDDTARKDERAFFGMKRMCVKTAPSVHEKEPEYRLYPETTCKRSDVEEAWRGRDRPVRRMASSEHMRAPKCRIRPGMTCIRSNVKEGWRLR